MNNNRNYYMRVSFCLSYCMLAYLFMHHPPWQPVDSQIYSSRNECVSYETQYEIKYEKTSIAIRQKIHFNTLSPVLNCFFYAEDFNLSSVKMWRNWDQVKISLEEINTRALAIRMVDGSFLEPQYNYTVSFSATKAIKPTDQGLVFKIYRDMYTMKM